ncbi:hypothetical protein RF11_07427 [Thelohanellus kitauei]|uniref:Uncharacterized protein n=1 Tax=Thelohanellus kitauei TaxID=669202 RepID=A0A0C2NEW9_THEKT|nr:hypothetical protein RF11_07427 [Thelohanellus kitauei]
MFSRVSDIEIEANKRAVERYTSIDPLSDVKIQMQAVRSFISWFKNENIAEVDAIFIDYFPKNLSNEFVRIKDYGNTVEDYSEKKLLLIDVFTFIFRNHHLLWECETQPFVDIFLKLIPNQDDMSAYNPDSLMNSIIICALNASNKVSFIKYNCMFHFYHNFIKENHILAHKFWDMCEEVYEPDISHTSFYFCEKITNCLDPIMTTFLTTGNHDMTRLLFIVVDMLYDQKLIDKIRFDLESFYSITDTLIQNYIDHEEYEEIIDNLPKIWSDIFNQNPITFQIDEIRKLTLFAALFSIDMVNKLMKVLVNGCRFEVTIKKTKKLYIIYLALVSLNQTDPNSRWWLVDLLKHLHQDFQEYLKKDFIYALPLEHQFLILQYYIKSSVTIQIELSRRDRKVINSVLDGLLTSPSLSLNRLFLLSQILPQSLDHDLSDDSYQPDISMKILGFMKDLTLALGDDSYIYILGTEKQLFMYEFIKINCLWNLNVDFVWNVFSRCRSDMTTDSQDWIPQKLGTSEYKIHNHIFGFILNHFDEFTLFEKYDRDHFLKLCSGNYTNLSEIPNNHEHFGFLTTLKDVYDTPR